MTDRPILFSRPMVRALLEGRKTQTRRVLKSQPPAGVDRLLGPEWYEPEVVDRRGELVPGKPVWGVYDEFGVWGTKVPFAPGDRLWVREAWQSDSNVDHLPPRDIPAGSPVWYPADGGGQFDTEFAVRSFVKTRPSMFMPRWASRLTLLVTDVRVQRLQEITAGDLSAEGMFASDFLTTKGDWPDRGFASIEQCRFHDLWDGLNAARGFGWAANPWVVAVTFEVERRNIDHG